jgi:PIN domain nuclease of toxin-antitoxin system
MNLLLDTHVFIWWATEPHKLSPHVLSALQNRTNRLVLSVVSIWEMQMKGQMGRLLLPVPAKEFVAVQCASNGIDILPVVEPHVWSLDQLPFLHKDPFDRLLAAQTLAEGYTLVTSDRLLRQYQVPLLTF